MFWTNTYYLLYDGRINLWNKQIWSERKIRKLKTSLNKKRWQGDGKGNAFVTYFLRIFFLYLFFLHFYIYFSKILIFALSFFLVISGIWHIVSYFPFPLFFLPSIFCALFLCGVVMKDSWLVMTSWFYSLFLISQLLLVEIKKEIRGDLWWW